MSEWCREVWVKMLRPGHGKWDLDRLWGCGLQAGMLCSTAAGAQCAVCSCQTRAMAQLQGQEAEWCLMRLNTSGAKAGEGTGKVGLREDA